jgi:hypothetical protein
MELLQPEVGPDGFCTGRDITPAGGAVRFDCTRWGVAAVMWYCRGGARHHAHIIAGELERGLGLFDRRAREDDCGPLRTVAEWIRLWDAE